MKKLTVFVLLLAYALTLTGCHSAADSGGAAPSFPASPSEALPEQPDTPLSAQSSDAPASSLPEGLPTTLASQEDLDGSGGYLLIGEIPEAGIALYCDNAEERNHAYLRYGDHFQAFDQDAWIDPTVLPKLSRKDWDEDGTMDLVVNYLRHEGTFYDGTAWVPGLVYEQVVYLWNGERWLDVHFYSSGPMRTPQN